MKGVDRCSLNQSFSFAFGGLASLRAVVGGGAKLGRGKAPVKAGRRGRLAGGVGPLRYA